MVFDDGVYLVVDQRLPVAYRMFYPGIFGIIVVADGNAYGVIGYPDALLLVYVEVVDGVSVHAVVAVVVGHNVGLGPVVVHVHLVDACTVGGYQQFLVAERADAVDADVSQFVRTCRSNLLFLGRIDKYPLL